MSVEQDIFFYRHSFLHLRSLVGETLVVVLRVDEVFVVIFHVHQCCDFFRDSLVVVCEQNSACERHFLGEIVEDEIVICFIVDLGQLDNVRMVYHGMIPFH